MKLSISIQAHESRAEYFPHLRERLGDVPFLVDVAGEKNLGCWLNNRRAWLAYDKTADFHVVIQDDAVVCKGFKEKAEAFIRTHYRPNRAFNFFLGKQERGTTNNDAVFKNALRDGYTVNKRNAWGVAICVPTKLIPQMIAFCDKFVNIPQDDVRIGKFLFAVHYDVCYPVPSYIEHRIGKSLVGNDSIGRQAYKYIENL